MPFIKTGKFEAQIIEEGDRIQKFDSLKDARTFAEGYVGNKAAAQPFKDELTFMYGRGDGTVSVVVREESQYTRA